MSLAALAEEAQGLRKYPAHAREGAAFGASELKSKVCEVASVDRIAKLAAVNPTLAKDELEHACDYVLKKNTTVEIAPQARETLKTEIIDSVFGFGPIEKYVNDETVTEIMINGAKDIYIERAGKIEKTNSSFESDDQVRVLIDKIIGPLGRRIDESSPFVNAHLPQGHRVNAVIPPISPDGPHVTIRAFARHVFTLEEMYELGSIDKQVMQFLEWIVKLRKNIVVSGGTGSGKTTLLNALSCQISEGERIITIEDAAELRLSPNLHVVRMEARPENSEGAGEVTIRALVKNSLRMRPDRIIVGECRGGEALDMLQAMNTGHDGSLTTVHANSPEDVIERMTTLVRFAVDLPLPAILAQIGTAFDYVIQVARDRTGERFVKAISEVEFNRADCRVLMRPIYERSEFAFAGSWKAEPLAFEEAHDAGIVDSEEASKWKSLALC